MTKTEIINRIIELAEEYEYVGIRFENKARKVGEICDNSRANDDRDDEREFPEYGTEEYDSLPELDGTCAYNVTSYGDITAAGEKVAEDAAEELSEADHAYIVVSNETGDMSCYIPDEDEILMVDAEVATVIY